MDKAIFTVAAGASIAAGFVYVVYTYGPRVIEYALTVITALPTEVVGG